MTSSNFLVYLHELGLSILLLGLYFDFGFNAQFFWFLMGVGLVLGEDECDPCGDIMEMHGVCFELKFLSNRYCAFLLRWSYFNI